MMNQQQQRIGSTTTTMIMLLMSIMATAARSSTTTAAASDVANMSKDVVIARSLLGTDAMTLSIAETEETEEDGITDQEKDDKPSVDGGEFDFSQCPAEGITVPPIDFLTVDSDGVDRNLVRRTWIPGYPGSGSEMMRVLIEKLTGLEASVSYHDDHCEEPHTISCKTHYPDLDIKTGTWDSFNYRHTFFSDRFMLLLRNPAHSIPSFFNFIWEFHHHVEDHSTQAPIEDWREWRDTNFEKEVDLWCEMLTLWVDASPFDLSMILPFEELVNPELGPAIVQDMADEFIQAQRDWLPYAVVEDMMSATSSDANIIDRSVSVPCLWKQIVMDHPSKKRVTTYEPGYTTTQKTYMLNAITNLIDWCQQRDTKIDSERIVNLLQLYHETIEASLIIDE